MRTLRAPPRPPAGASVRPQRRHNTVKSCQASRRRMPLLWAERATSWLRAHGASAFSGSLRLTPSLLDQRCARHLPGPLSQQTGSLPETPQGANSAPNHGQLTAKFITCGENTARGPRALAAFPRALAAFPRALPYIISLGGGGVGSRLLIPEALGSPLGAPETGSYRLIHSSQASRAF